MKLYIYKSKSNSIFYMVKSFRKDGKSTSKIVEKLGTLEEVKQNIIDNNKNYEVHTINDNEKAAANYLLNSKYGNKSQLGNALTNNRAVIDIYHEFPWLNEQTILKEEYLEVINANGKDRIEELADMLEVIIALAKMENATLDDIIATARAKASKRGAFNDKIFLEKVIDK